MPTALRIIIYPIFALLSFIVFFVMLFPFESIKGRIETEVERGLGGQYEVKIKELAMAPLTGVAIDNVVVSEKRGKREPVFTLDKATVHVDILPLIWGALKVGYDLRSTGGRIYGRLERSGDQMKVEATLKDLNLAAVPLLKTKWGVGLSSDVDGTVDLELYPRAPLRNNGTIQLKIPKLKVGESNIMNMMTLPPMDLAAAKGQSQVDIIMNRGSIEIRSFDLKGGDLTLALGGKVYLAQRVSNFRFNIRGKLGFNDKVMKAIPLLMVVEKQKGPDGLYPLTVTGQIRKPNIRVGDFRIPI